jgi:ATP-binding protein involved in chromosome partitioning
METDFRVPLIRERLRGFKLVVPVTSPKGGVGKTTISVGLALALARSGVQASLLDTDFTNPTTHISLGVDVEELMPEEEKGVLPVKVEENLEFMSIAFYSKDRALPLRGRESVDAFRELLAVTRWTGKVFVVDTPPGLSDTLLELLRLHRKVRILVASTCDKMSIVSTKRILEFLDSEKVESLGVVANMCSQPERIREALGIEPIASIPYHEEMPSLEGDRDRLAETLRPYLEKLIKQITSQL